ncbi:MAG: crotonase/enoyl-CoA hydratase family protein [Neisseria sp.]|nr:crotonase/enoyl-CoA hydratase family protein [Neisseria sp.]
MKTLSVELRNDIAVVWLNRPDKKNAMSFTMMRELIAVARDLGKNRTVRAVILAGRGDAFCAGIDLADLNNPRNRLPVFWQLIKPGRSFFQAAALAWRDLPQPVIAAVHGHCLGAGVQLMLGADFRFAHADSRIAIMETRWGIVPDMGLSASARGLVAPDVLKELTMSARIIDGDEALRCGLVTQVVDDPFAAAYACAENLCARSPDALLASKRVLHAMQHSPRKSLRAEKIWQLKLLLGKNQRRAVKKDRQPDTAFLPRQYD